MFERVALIGLGLIGSSLAHAVKRERLAENLGSLAFKLTDAEMAALDEEFHRTLVAAAQNSQKVASDRGDAAALR